MQDAIKRARARLDHVIEQGEATLATKYLGAIGPHLEDEAGYTHFRMTAKSVLQKLDFGGRFEREFDFIDGRSARSWPAERLPDLLGVLKALRDDFDDGVADENDSDPQLVREEAPRSGRAVVPPDDDRPLVFISCGQFSRQEVYLGKQIAKLVNEQTGAIGYFAQNQTSLDALTDHIFKALDRAVGFVAVMHKRGRVTNPEGDLDKTRASVWIEQEIAIAGFIQKTRNANLRVQAYVENGISLEGAREKLMLNPILFRTNAQVTKHLKKVLKTWDIALPVVDAPTATSS